MLKLKLIGWDNSLFGATFRSDPVSWLKRLEGLGYRASYAVEIFAVVE